jgi:hypothetical protein
VCGFHAHQRTLFPPVTIASTWEATDNLLMNRVIIFIILMLLKYTEMLWDFNFRKSYWFNREETFLMMSDVLWVLIFFF